MTPELSTLAQRQPFALLGKAGLYSSGGTGGVLPADGSFVEFFLYLILGAFCGVILGLMMSHVMRFVMMASGRAPSGFSWTAAGALLGLLVFGLMAIKDWKEE